MQSKNKNTFPKKSSIPLTKKQKRARRGRRFLRVFITVSVLIIALHIGLPHILLTYANKKMANMPEYIGHTDALRMNLFTGTVTIIGTTLKKRGGEIPVPFIDVKKLKVTIDWKALFKGRVVALITVDDFDVNFVKGPTKATSQSKVDKEWIELFDDFIPIEINRVKVNNGSVHYRDYHSNPKIDIFMDKIYVVGENLSTVKDTSKVLPATVKVTANAYGGTLAVNTKVDPLNTIPTFDVNAELKNLPLTYLNSFLKAYAKMDVQKGTFSVYAEAAAKDGKIKGYAKPFIKDLDVIDDRERKDMPFKDQVIESLVEVVAWIFENKKTDRVATKVELEGSIKNPDISVWGIIGETLVNAFIEALIPTIENSININAIGTEDDKNFLEKIFDKDKKSKKNKKNKKPANKKKTKKKPISKKENGSGNN